MKREKTKILDNKIFLYLTEFFSGMSVMAVELGASRLLAPYFSSSQIVWTIVIGTIMIAMALGNIYGGKSADKNPNPDKLYGRIIISAIWIALIPVVGKYIILGVSALLIFTVNSNFLIIAAFAACMLIFVFPLFLLGTVTPSLAKYSVENLEESGKVIGTLGAYNTIDHWQHHRYICADLHYHSGSGNLLYIPNLFGHTAGTFRYLFYQCTEGCQAPDCFGNTACVMLRHGTFPVLCFLGK